MLASSIHINLPEISNTHYLIIVSMLWIVLFILWLKVLIWDIKLNKINEQLYSQLYQLQRKSEQPQANNLPSHDIDCLPFPFHDGESEVEDSDSLS